MTDNLDKYLPEFDDEEMRQRLSAFDKEDLIFMLVRAYKERRIFAKLLDEQDARAERIRMILDEPPALLRSPGVPTADDLKRMSEDDPGEDI